MGRRPDPPGLQAAKGHPGKRKLTVKAREAEARRVAKLLAETPGESADVLAPPKYLDGRFPGALQVWRSLAPRLQQTHRLMPLHRPIFAQFCVYFSEWVSCNEDIAKHGFYQIVPTVSGDDMERVRPSVKMREIAFANVMQLSGHFGLTPTDEFSLFKDQRNAAMSNPGLFDQGALGDEPAAESDAPAAEPKRSLIGSLSGLDSPPPGSRPN